MIPSDLGGGLLARVNGKETILRRIFLRPQNISFIRPPLNKLKGIKSQFIGGGGVKSTLLEVKVFGVKNKFSDNFEKVTMNAQKRKNLRTVIKRGGTFSLPSRVNLNRSFFIKMGFLLTLFGKFQSHLLKK